MEEIWKDIEGYNGKYQVSNLGRVKSLKGSEKILKPRVSNTGYKYVNLCIQGKSKTLKIHRLVAQAFLPNPEGLPQVNHKDEDKLNNNVDNLEWCTREYNCNYGTRNKRIASTGGIKVICIETGIAYDSILEAKRCTGINNTDIAEVCKGIRKTAGGFHWRYMSQFSM